MKPNIFNIPLEPPEKKPRRVVTGSVVTAVYKYGHAANSGKTLTAWLVDGIATVRSYDMYIAAYIGNEVLIYNNEAKTATTQRHVHQCKFNVGSMDFVICNGDIAKVTTDDLVEYNTMEIQRALFKAVRSREYPLAYVHRANSYLASLTKACQLLNHPMPDVSWGAMLDDESLQRRYIKKQLLGDRHAQAFAVYGN